MDIAIDGRNLPEVSEYTYLCVLLTTVDLNRMAQCAAHQHPGPQQDGPGAKHESSDQSQSPITDTAVQYSVAVCEDDDDQSDHV